MPGQRQNLKRIVSTAGVLIAFMMGSGFATGQEVLQYFASYGLWGLGGIAICFVLLMYVSISYVRVGFREKFSRPSQIYTYYCGKYVGVFFDYFTVAAIYLCFTVMIAGAGATMKQHFELPVPAGAVLIGVLTCITVMLGLKHMVDIIGRIGPVLIVLVLVLGIGAILQGGVETLGKAVLKIQEMELMRASSNWVFSAFSYVGISIVWLATFMTALGGRAESGRDASIGIGLGVTAFSIGMLIMSIALMLHIDAVAGTQIPSLVLAAGISPLLATVFTVIVVVCTYTAAVPLLWTVSYRLAPDGTPRFRIITCALALGGTAVGLLIPFSKLVNVVYVLIGYLGFVLLGFMLVKQHWRPAPKKRSDPSGKSVNRVAFKQEQE